MGGSFTWDLALMFAAWLASVVGSSSVLVHLAMAQKETRARLFPRQLASLAVADLVFSSGVFAENVLELGVGYLLSEELFADACMTILFVLRSGKFASLMIEVHLAFSLSFASLFRSQWLIYLSRSLTIVWVVAIIASLALTFFILRLPANKVRHPKNNFAFCGEKDIDYFTPVLFIGSFVLIVDFYAYMMYRQRFHCHSYAMIFLFMGSYLFPYTVITVLYCMRIGNNDSDQGRIVHLVSTVLEELNGLFNALCYFYLLRLAVAVFRIMRRRVGVENSWPVRRPRSFCHRLCGRWETSDWNQNLLLMLCYIDGVYEHGDDPSLLTAAVPDSLLDLFGLTSCPEDVPPRTLSRVSSFHPPSMSAPAPVIFNDLFVVERELGQGTYGKVELVWAKASFDRVIEGQRYALKVFADRGRGIQEEDKLHGERGLMESLDHWGVVRLVASLRWSDGGERVRALALEYCSGGTIEDRVCNNASAGLDRHQVIQYASEIREALSYIHSVDVIHRDLSPDNILITESDHCKIADFGLSKHVQSAKTLWVGKEAYMAPEVQSSSSQGPSYGKPADVYSFGVVVLFMAVGNMDDMFHSDVDPNDSIPEEGRASSSPILSLLRSSVRERMSQHVSLLLEATTARNPEARMNVDQLRELSLFANVNWDQLRCVCQAADQAYLASSSCEWRQVQR